MNILIIVLHWLNHCSAQKLDCSPPAKLSKKRKLLSKLVPSKRSKLDEDNQENLLDMTEIHPESYSVAYKWVKCSNLKSGNGNHARVNVKSFGTIL